jgi:hypothetical protein
VAKRITKTNTKTEPGPKNLKEVLAHDYKISGISRRYYMPVAVIAMITTIVFAWEFPWASWDEYSLVGVLTLTLISITSTTFQRLVRGAGRRTRLK